ncbi:hypothetical protein [Bartonella sp. LJL80]
MVNYDFYNGFLISCSKERFTLREGYKLGNVISLSTPMKDDCQRSSSQEKCKAYVTCSIHDMIKSRKIKPYIDFLSDENRNNNRKKLEILFYPDLYPGTYKKVWNIIGANDFHPEQTLERERIEAVAIMKRCGAENGIDVDAIYRQ